MAVILVVIKQEFEGGPARMSVKRSKEWDSAER